MLKKNVFSWTYLGQVYVINWIFIGLLVAVSIVAVITGKDSFGGVYIFAGILLFIAGFSGIAQMYNLKFQEANRKMSLEFDEERLMLEEEFAQAVKEYRKIVINNDAAQIGAEKSTELIEHKITDLFKTASLEHRAKLACMLITIMGRPMIYPYDANKGVLVSAQLQKLTFQKYDNLKKI
jgi:uncharacterized membrane protein YuzA (DUF378 family)